jgi:hypothetical protein
LRRIVDKRHDAPTDQGRLDLEGHDEAATRVEVHQVVADQGEERDHGIILVDRSGSAWSEAGRCDRCRISDVSRRWFDPQIAGVCSQYGWDSGEGDDDPQQSSGESWSPLAHSVTSWLDGGSEFEAGVKADGQRHPGWGVTKGPRCDRADATAAMTDLALRASRGE